MITKEEAIQRIGAADIERLFYPVISDEIGRSELESKKIGSGISAVPGRRERRSGFLRRNRRVARQRRCQGDSGAQGNVA